MPSRRALLLVGLLALAACGPATGDRANPAAPGEAARPGAAVTGDATVPPNSDDPALQDAAARGGPVGPPLDAFNRRLAALEAGHAGRVEILQLGDSHTAGGFFSLRLREMLQARFGSAGPGFMVAGLPFPGAQRPDMSVGQTGKWLFFNSLKASDRADWGISGFIARSAGAGAAMTLTPKSEEPFDTVEVDLVDQPNGGALLIEVDGLALRRVSTNGPSGRPRVERLKLATPGRVLRLVAMEAKPVDVAGWAIETNQPGVVLDSAGVVGAQVGVIDRWNEAVVAREIAERDPALIILAFGTNEGFERDIDLAGYGATFTMITRKLRRMAPKASLLALGPMDGETLPAACRKLAQVPRCQATPPPPRQCAWYPPPSLEGVRGVQARLARFERFAFWDWASVMPKPCGMDDWVKRDPPLGRGDHVHLTREGYAIGAEALYAWLMEDYERFGRGHRLAQR